MSHPQFQQFFVVGPLRTGSSLISRCLDDHPAAICLCESEINRALLGEYAIPLHYRRMGAHGLGDDEARALLEGRRLEDLDALHDWYRSVRPHLARLYGKPPGAALGDKSPDFYRSPRLVADLAARHRLIYTTRDPRAIFLSIYNQDDASLAAKAERWSFLFENFLTWKPHLDQPNLIVVRYEDLVSMPEETMSRVYRHIGLDNSTRFLEPFHRPHPARFLWKTAVDWDSGIRQDFDSSRISSWKSLIPEPLLRQIEADPFVVEFMKRFDYQVQS